MLQYEDYHTDTGDLMARISNLEDLLERLNGDQSVKDGIRSMMRFGLVYEDSHEEVLRLVGGKVTAGCRVDHRSPAIDRFGTVVRAPRDVTLDKGVRAVSWDDDPDEIDFVAESSLVPIAKPGETVYSGLNVIDEVRRGGDKPAHLVIQGENLHALQTLRYTHAGKVDVAMIDPPYNSGGDLIYNDHYVAKEDSFRHSKWLSFMEHRLRIARDLLSDTGIIIVAIDDNEQAHLRLLMDEIFGAQNFIANVVWQGGRKNDSRYVSVGHDYMLIYAKSASALSDAGIRWREEKPGLELVLETGQDAWRRALWGALVETERDRYDLYVRSRSLEDSSVFHPDYSWEWAKSMIEDADRRDRAFATQIRTRAAELATSTMRAWFKAQPKDAPVQAMSRNVYFLPDGRLCRDTDVSWPGGGGPRYDVLHPATSKPVPVPERGWIYSTPERMQRAIDAGEVVFRADHTKPISIKRPLESVTGQVAMSVFDRQRTHAGRQLKDVFGGEARFKFPKDTDVLARWIGIATSNNPNAVVLDFFGGSGSTAHAVLDMNATDNGSRQCILVTNNEVEEKQRKQLVKDGHFPGDPEFEKHGIFQHVTYPRIKTVATGIREDGSTYSEGLDENVVFTELTYTHPSSVRLGRNFAEVAPLLWARAGQRGEIITNDEGATFCIGSNYAITFDAGAATMAEFAAALVAADLPEAADVFIVSDDDEQYSRACVDLSNFTVHRLYQDYLVNFEVKA